MAKILELPELYQRGFKKAGAKPDGLLEVDWSNDLTRGLQLAFVDNVEVVHGTVGVPVASNSRKGMTLEGVCVESESTTDGGWAFRNCGIDDALTGSTATTIATLMEIDSQAAFGAMVGSPDNLSTWSSPFYSLGLARRGTSGLGTELGLRVASSTSSSLVKISGSGFLEPDGSLHLYAVGRDSSSTLFFKDGAQHSSDSGLSSSQYIEHDNVYLMSRNDAATAEGTDGRCYVTLIWDRKLSAEEHRRLNDNVYQLFKPKDPGIVFIPDAGSGTSVTSTLVNLTLAEQDTSVSVDKNISATSVNLTLAEHDASISRAKIINATTVNLTLAEQAADIQRRLTVAATLETLTLTPYQASITVGGAVVVSATSVNLTLAEQDATITHPVDVTISVTSVGLTLTEHNPVVSHAPFGDSNNLFFGPII